MYASAHCSIGVWALTCTFFYSMPFFTEALFMLLQFIILYNSFFFLLFNSLFVCCCLYFSLSNRWTLNNLFVQCKLNLEIVHIAQWRQSNDIMCLWHTVEKHSVCLWWVWLWLLYARVRNKAIPVYQTIYAYKQIYSALANVLCVSITFKLTTSLR